MDGNPFSRKPFIFSNHAKVVPGCARLYAPTNPNECDMFIYSIFSAILIIITLHIYHSFQLGHGRYG